MLLIFDDPNGTDSHLVRVVEDVRGETRISDPLLVVYLDTAGSLEPRTVDDVRDLPPSAPPSNAPQLWDDWRVSWSRDRSVGSRRVLRFGLEAADAEPLNHTRPVIARRRRPWLAHPLLPWLVAGALVIVGVARVVDATAGFCAPGIQRVSTGECIGISDGGYPFHKRLKPLLTTIHKANQAVLDNGHPYMTVIYFSSLSRPPEKGEGFDDLLADVHGELAGLALIQRDLIKNSNDKSKLQLRILVANAGSEYRFARQVVDQVKDRVADDRTIVGAVGFGESRQIVHEAINALGQISLPMIGTTGTYNNLGLRPNGSFTSSYFPLAPPNSELAQHAAVWAREGIRELGIPRARRPVVLLDDSVADLYGRDLGEQYLAALGSMAKGERFKGAADVEDKVAKICSQTERPDFIFYAGRSAQFGSFVDALTRTRCHKVTVIAGDAVTQYVNDHALKIGRNNRVRIMYTPLASASSWSKSAQEYRTVFYDNLAEMLRSSDFAASSADRQPSPGYAAQAFDAMDAIVRSAQIAYSVGRGGTGELDRGGVLLALENLAPVDGSSGVVKLHGDKGGHYAKDRPVMLITMDRNGKQQLVRQCGKLFQQQSSSC